MTGGAIVESFKLLNYFVLTYSQFLPISIWKLLTFVDFICNYYTFSRLINYYFILFKMKITIILYRIKFHSQPEHALYIVKMTNNYLYS